MTNNQGMNTAVAGGVGLVSGAVIGATVAALVNPNTREKIADKVNEVKEKVGDMASGAQDKVQGVKEDLAKKLVE